MRTPTTDDPMFTYTLAQPRRPIAQALNATIIHASLIAGAVWATKSVAIVDHPRHEVIDISGFAPARPPACNCSASFHEGMLAPVPSDLPLIPEVPPVIAPVGIHQIDARAFILGDSTALTRGLESDSTASGAVFDEAVVDELPTLLVAGQLRYPAVQREAGIEGTVTLSYVIDAEGRVEQDGVEVVSATLPAFVPAAEAAVLTSRFHPAMKRHTPVRVRARQTVTFRR